jgi:hypothetical protein
MPAFTSSTFNRYAGKWLIATGIFELGLAAVFVVGALLEPILTFGFLLTSAILGATGLGLVWFGLRARRSAADADRIASTGLAGTATITGLTQTGMSLNDQPQVEMELLVSIPGRAPYAATRKEFVPLILLGRLSSGLPLAVKVDPADPQRLIIDWSAPASVPAPASGAAFTGGLGGASAGGATMGGQTETLAQVQAALAESGLPAAAPFASPEQGGYTVDQLRAAVRANGIDGTATIDKLADTGEIVGDERLFTMQLTLHVPGQPDRQLTPSAAMVPITAADQVAIGRTIPVKVAPDNPNLVLFEWEKLAPDAPAAPDRPSTII